MIRTPYYDLAEMIVNNNGLNKNSISIFCCVDLPRPNAKIFSNTYKLDAFKSKIHKAEGYAWMSDIVATQEQNYNHRVIALLLLHEMEVNP